MMAMMTAQRPLPLAPHGARPVGAAAAIIEDDDGGGVAGADQGKPNEVSAVADPHPGLSRRESRRLQPASRGAQLLRALRRGPRVARTRSPHHQGAATPR